MSRATFRFESPRAAQRAANELRAAGYETAADPNNGDLGLAVAFDAADADTDVPPGKAVDLGSDFDRLERLITTLGGELDTWQVSRSTEIMRPDPSHDF